jgi:hypothetical protein
VIMPFLSDAAFPNPMAIEADGLEKRRPATAGCSMSASRARARTYPHPHR